MIRSPRTWELPSAAHARLVVSLMTLTFASWIVGACARGSLADEPSRPSLERLDMVFRQDLQPLLRKYCFECHADSHVEAEIDLSAYRALTDVRREARVWQKVAEMLDSAQMPPQDSPQPTAPEKSRLRDWVRVVLTMEAEARAGDPGPVVMRRLSNAEYTYTLRDLTGIESLAPAREFPVDSAAGEGFTNVGNSLVMSPTMLTKYLDAAKGVAQHLVLLPDGVRFSPSTTRRDWTNEYLQRIRDYYARYSTTGGGSAVNLQGIQFETNQGGRLPLEQYLAATVAERESLAASDAANPRATNGIDAFDRIARERRLSPQYLRAVWSALHEPSPPPSPPTPATILGSLRERWRTARPGDVPALVSEFGRWQAALWRFNSIGHIGREGGVRSWMEPVEPIAARQEFRVKLPAGDRGQDVVVRLLAHDAQDGNQHDWVVWERPRLVAPGRPDILLRDVRQVALDLEPLRRRQFAQAARCLEVAAKLASADADNSADLKSLATENNVDEAALAAWLEYLGIRGGGDVQLGPLLTRKMENGAGYDFIRGWVADDALSVVANSSDQTVRIPGTMKPRGVAVHPAPTIAVAVGWKSPVKGALKVVGSVQHAHTDCGNGVAWVLEARRGGARHRLAAGLAVDSNVVPLGPFEGVNVRPGDVIALVIHPRDNNHACDLTAIELTLSDGQREWSLGRDVSADILAGNPHADSLGNNGVWHFYTEPAAGAQTTAIPAGSLLSRWHSTTDASERRALSESLQRLLDEGPGQMPPDSPDAQLYRQLTSLDGPFLAAAWRTLASQPPRSIPDGMSRWGLDAAQFGRHPRGGGVEPASLCVQAPRVLEIRLPAELAAGAELAVTGMLHADTGREGTVMLDARVGEERDASVPAPPVIAMEGSESRVRLARECAEFRRLFPPALCYTKIVPVDEVVTLTLYYREDEPYRRLMLSDAEARELDRLWDEMLYVAREPLEMVVAFEQISEFATQDRPDLVKAFAPLRQPILDRAAAFRARLASDEPRQLESLIELAHKAYRRPLTDEEGKQLRSFYAGLRQQEIPHDESLRLTMARMLISPAFLYKAETPGPGAESAPVSDWELATRLSYFLWSSQPDEELRGIAAAGRLREPDVLAAQTRRMLKDARTRRLATEFACHWLHIYDFDNLNEKSERHFPTFVELRGPMYEESLLFLTDLFQADRSLLNVLDADYTFLNEALARHYGIPDVTGPEWRRVTGVRTHQRGGILTQATALSKQAGASRTSPILRGNWLSEVVLGEKLPKPPKNVPQLSETAPEGLTERQMIELHSTDPACAKCHARIDPFGFALENFDAIGRFRTKDAAGLTIDARTKLPDGTAIEGVEGLRNYLLTTRRDAFVRQFCRKLLGYALGRSVQLSDEPLLNEMRTALQAHDFRVATAVETIVRSRQFREIRGRELVVDE